MKKLVLLSALILTPHFALASVKSDESQTAILDEIDSQISDNNEIDELDPDIDPEEMIADDKVCEPIEMRPEDQQLIVNHSQNAWLSDFSEGLILSKSGFDTISDRL